MARRNNSKTRAFMLTESLVVIAIFLAIISVSLGMYVSAYKIWREVAALAEAQQKASITVRAIVYGIRGSGESKVNGLLEAKSFTIPTSSEIDFTSGVDSQVRSFYLDANNNLVYSPPVGNDTTVVKGLSSLTFTQETSKRVKVTVTAHSTVINKTIQVSLENSVVIRNAR